MDVKEAHKIIFQYLKDLNTQDPEFRFFVFSNEPFSHTDFPNLYKSNYLYLSFWNGKTEKNPAYLPISLSIYFDGNNPEIKLVSSDYDIELGDYLKVMAESLGFNAKKVDHTKYNWTKSLKINKENYVSFLEEFIEIDKNNIDKYLSENILSNHINAIPQEKFIENFSRNDVYMDTFLNDDIKQPKPCTLKYLEVANYQGIKSLTINNLPIDAQWIFLTGENGFGKTSVLRAIAKGLVGDEERVTQIDHETKLLSAVNYEGELIVEKGEKGINIVLPFVVLGYGISRFNTNGSDSYVGTHTLFEDNGSLINIEKLLLTADDKTFNKIKGVFKTLIPNLADIKKENYGGFYKIVYQEKSDNGETFDPVELSDLAAGYRGIITMIGDMLAHFIPQVSSSLDLSKDIGGIVIIDEFDAHLHPKYQYELPSLLSKVFPNVQFIVSTHSPIPILGVEQQTAVVFTVNRTKKEGIRINRLDTEIEIDKLSANALLTSDIFGFKDIFARGSTPDTIEPFNNYDDIKQMKEPEKLNILKSGLKALKIKL
jgi:energy-coupling factor transporter ATP-binding protein EcfA2